VRSDFSARLAGSSDIFERRGRRPHASINFVASHDGFTLRDTVSYAERHNEANGEDNKDGHADNYSANWGAEGPSDDSAIEQTRHRLQCAILTSLFLSQGTPMLLAGDEFGRSQAGNNNAYCQDNEISWLDWTLADTAAGKELSALVARLARLRHQYPILRCDKFLHGRDEPAPGLIDIAWFDEQGQIISSDAWNDPQRRTLVLRRVQEVDGNAVVLTCFFNPEADDRAFKLPPPRLPTQVLVDSAAPTAPEWKLETDTLTVTARSVVMTRGVQAAEPK
jgi:isoamylase